MGSIIEKLETEAAKDQQQARSQRAKLAAKKVKQSPLARMKELLDERHHHLGGGSDTIQWFFTYMGEEIPIGEWGEIMDELTRLHALACHIVICRVEQEKQQKKLAKSRK